MPSQYDVESRCSEVRWYCLQTCSLRPGSSSSANNSSDSFFLRKNYSSDSESVVFGSIFIVSLKSLGQKAFTPGALASSHVYRRTHLSHDRGSALPPAVFFLMLGLTCDHSSVDFATPLPPLASPRATDRC
jgi:hypothetical protein